MIRKFNKEKYSKLFLLVYSCFIVITIIHHHHYNLDSSVSYKTNNEINDSALLDFLSGGDSVCAVHFSSQTVSDIHYSVDELELTLKDFKVNIHLETTHLSKNSNQLIQFLRAPPEIS